MVQMRSDGPYTGFQLTALVVLRMLIGWHFLYEGVAKIANPYWSSAGYLSESKWWLSDVFVSLAANPGALGVVDFLNKWGLVLIGLALVVGLFTRFATVVGAILLFIYYVAAPPFVGLTYAMPTEGAYLIVNKTLIEAVALLVLIAFPTGKLFGLDRLLARRAGASRVRETPIRESAMLAEESR